MKNQKNQIKSQPRQYNFNSMILAGRQSSLDSHYSCQQDYNAKIKQIKALKKFQEMFKKQQLKNEQKKQIIPVPIQEKFYNKNSPHQRSNRLKGMFFLRKKAEIKSKYHNQQSQNQYEEQQQNKIKGKTVSPTKLNKSKEKILNFVQMSVVLQQQKYYRRTLVPRRPLTQLESSISQQRIFNTHTLYSAILGANKVKLLGVRPANFVYFSVYVEEGNNSQMIKAAVRKRSGWKVVQLPNVANMIWSQYYKRSYDLKLRYKKPTQKSFDQSLQLNQTNSVILDDIKRKKKRTQKDLNIMTKQQYNKELHKICPKLEHLHRKPQAFLQNCNLFFYNHIPNNHFVTDKKNLLINMKALYQKQGKDVFEVMPFSLNINQTIQLKNILGLLPNEMEHDVQWIVKPGQNSNRGRGIIVCKGLQSAISEINSRFNSTNNLSGDDLIEVSSKENIEDIKIRKQGQTLVLQKYIQPLLYFKRKFDIRMYLLVTSINKKIRGYVYNQGYIRTSSKIFTMSNFNKFIHLTNDAIQTKSSDYGKFQQGNKVSWKKFQKWLEDEGHFQFWPNFVKDYKTICKNILESVQTEFTKKHMKYGSDNILSKHKRLFKKNQEQKFSSIQNRNPAPHAQSKVYFQVFGLDFLIDHQMKTWLIEVNTNPALTTDCSRVVNSLIPAMIQNTFSIAIQPFLKSPNNRQYDNIKYQNSFQVVYDDQWKN